MYSNPRFSAPNASPLRSKNAKPEQYFDKTLKGLVLQKRISECEKLWHAQVCPRLIARSQLIDPSQLDEAMDLREQIASQLLTVSASQSTQKLENSEITLESPLVMLS